MQGNIKTNTSAISIGFFLIIIIAAITLSRSYFTGHNDASVKTNTPTSNGSNQGGSIKSDPTQLSSEELLKKISAGDKMIIIDMRDQEAFDQEHIIDSKNITLQEITSNSPLVDKNITYVLVNDGTQENLISAREAMLKKGATNVFYLTDSFQTWKDTNSPTISSGNPESFVDKAKTKYVKSDEFNGFINTEKNLLIIDLRSSANYKIGHIKGAINIPLDELEARRHELPIGKNIVLYDKDGLWAFQGAVRLFDLGFFNVLYLSDGFDVWSTKGYPTEK